MEITLAHISLTKCRKFQESIIICDIDAVDCTASRGTIILFTVIVYAFICKNTSHKYRAEDSCVVAFLV